MQAHCCHFMVYKRVVAIGPSRGYHGSTYTPEKAIHATASLMWPQGRLVWLILSCSHEATT